MALFVCSSYTQLSTFQNTLLTNNSRNFRAKENSFTFKLSSDIRIVSGTVEGH